MMEAARTQVQKRYRPLVWRTPERLSDRLVERFDARQRAEHLVLLVTFVALAATGVPQKFAGADPSRWIIAQLGGIEAARFLHRALAVAFMVLSLEHVAGMLAQAARGRLRPTMAPSLADVQNAVQMIRYCLGLTRSHPHFDRYDYRQKFEYWGIVFGSTVMILSGLILWFPAVATRILPGEFVAAAREAHSNEALLALLVVVVWHLYSVVLSPTCFPGDLSIFTGRISERRLLEEHALEHRRLVAGGRLPARVTRAGVLGRRRFRSSRTGRQAAARRESSRARPH